MGDTASGPDDGTEPLDSLLFSFETALIAAKKRPRTVDIYKDSVEAFTAWLVHHGKQPVLAEVTRTNIRNFLADLARQGKKPNTVLTRHRSLSRFCNFLVNDEILPKNPMARLEEPEVGKPNAAYLEDDEIRQILKTCQGADWKNRRDEAIVRLLIDTGLRVGELCSVTVDNVDLREGIIPVRGKGNKFRLVYLSPTTRRAVDRWIRARRRLPHADKDVLLIGHRGAMTPDGVRRVVQTRGRAAGLTKPVHPHLFRHSWAHHYLISGGEGQDLKRLAGWTSSRMLEVYASSGADKRAQEAVRRMRPGDRF